MIHKELKLFLDIKLECSNFSHKIKKNKNKKKEKHKKFHKLFRNENE